MKNLWLLGKLMLFFFGPDLEEIPYSIDIQIVINVNIKEYFDHARVSGTCTYKLGLGLHVDETTV
jgi:hypothetical protein